MLSETLLSLEDLQPICVGTGYVVLDAVLNGNSNSPLQLTTGGSCGNVLTILSYLGWQTYPVVKLGKDVSAEIIQRDFARWNVQTALISRSEVNNTPIIIEKLSSKTNGSVKHDFKFFCPDCGQRLPRYQALSINDVHSLVNTMPIATVFYFDRVRRSLLELAKANRDKGSLIIFEPSSIRSEKLFLECLEVAHIVKYSDERLKHIQSLTNLVNIPLEIETLGISGLRYRVKTEGETSSNWTCLPAYSVNELVDSAGSGDWCTAGLIHVLGRNGVKSFMEARAGEIEKALSFGQVLAALNCYYEGARGSMYALTKEGFEVFIESIRQGKNFVNKINDHQPKGKHPAFKLICPNCLRLEDHLEKCGTPVLINQ